MENNIIFDNYPNNLGYKIRLLEKKKDPALSSNISLKSLCHNRVLKICCFVAQNGNDGSLNHWRNQLLETLPGSLRNDLTSDLNHYSFAPRNQSNMPMLAKVIPRNISTVNKSLPNDLIASLRNIENLNLFKLWYQFFDEKYTKSAGIPVQNLDFTSSLTTCLNSFKFSIISELYITYNWILKSELSSLLSHLKDTLKTLHVFALKGSENQVLEFVTESPCQIEELKFLERTDLKLNKRTILKFLQNQQKSLRKLDLTFWLDLANLYCDVKLLEPIFKQISEMKQLEKLCIMDHKYLVHCLKYLNMNGLSIYFYSENGNNKRIECITELMDLCQTMPLATISDIRVKFEGGKQELCPSDNSPSFNNIESIYCEFDSNEPNDGWFVEAEWKNLEHLSVCQNNKNFQPRSQNPVDFSHPKWKMTFPQLQVVSLVLLSTPFPYCSLTSILFGSPNLCELSIHLAKSAIQEFDIQDFRKRLRNHSLKLKTIRLKNRYLQGYIRYPERFRPIIPFESLTDLMNSSPRISKLEAVLSHDEVDLLKQNYDLEIVEDLYYVF